MSASWAAHVKPTIKLALPVMFARAGILIIAIVDTIMCGWAGSDALAWFGMGAALHIPLLLVGIGFLVSTVVMTAQIDGSGNSQACGSVWRTGLAYAALIGLILFLICLFGEPFLLGTGQTAEMSANGGAVLTQFGWGLPGVLMFTASIFFLEALHKPIPGMIIMGLANLLNAFLNWVFIFGNWGAAEMGAAGASFATSIARWFMFVAVLLYIHFRIDHKRYGIFTTNEPIPDVSKRFRRVGYPMALGQGLESSSFSVLTLYAGWVSTAAVAAWTIAMNILALIFMFSLGFAIAGGVRVGNAIGRNDTIGVHRAGWTAVGLTVIWIGVISALMFLFRVEIASLFSDESVVKELAIFTLAIAAILVMIPDGTQAVLIGALRGASDFWAATWLQSLSFWGVMLPAGYYLCIVKQGSAPALMTSVGIGAIVATLLLGARFEWISRLRPSP